MRRWRRIVDVLALGVTASLVCACGSARLVTPEQYVAEFLTEGKSMIAPDGWWADEHERLMSDAELFRALRATNPQVTAVAILDAGVHPRWTLVFVEEGSQVRLIATLTYWGLIQQKIATQLPIEEFSDIRQRITAAMTCTATLERASLWRGFVFWEGDQILYCDADPFGEDGQLLGDLLVPALETGELQFSVWEEDNS